MYTVVREGFFVQETSEQELMLEMVQELLISGRGTFEIEQTACSRVLRQECVWVIEGAARSLM